MKKWLKRTIIGFVGFLAIIFISTVANEAIQGQHTADKQKNAETAVVKKKITSDGLFLAINEVRHKHGLEQFKRNSLLDKSAKLKCADMKKHNYYEHDNPKTGKAGYKYVEDVGQLFEWASENLNQGSFNSPKEVITSWMDSEAHEASILDPRYTEIGFAICTVPKWKNEITVVQHKIEPAKPVQVQQQSSSQPRYDYTRNLYQTEQTRCTTRDTSAYSYNDYETSCTTSNY